jgi:antitoxin component YwqK of YwqJK toxin-antitoxin module
MTNNTKLIKLSDGYRIEQYKNGQLDGIRETYYNTGDLETTEPYKEGKLHGVVKHYNYYGELTTEHGYNMGRPHGLWRTYTPDGSRLLMEKTYVFGVLDKAEKFF